MDNKKEEGHAEMNLDREKVKLAWRKEHNQGKRDIDGRKGP